MIRAGFLREAERRALIKMARNGLAEHRVARRANAIVLLDQGWSCEKVAAALLLDDDTVRGWCRAYEKDGLEGLTRFGHEGSECRLTEEQQAAVKAFVTKRLPRSTNAVGAWLKKNFAIEYSHSGLITLLHRLGFEYRKPCKNPAPSRRSAATGLHRQLREASQQIRPRRSGRVRGCCASDASSPRCRLLGAKTDHRCC